MDDMYHYAAAAANGDRGTELNEVTEENDPILQAFNNFGWRSHFNNIFDTGETIVNVTKKDFQEFANVLREDMSSITTSPDADNSEGEEQTSTEPSTISSLRERLSKFNPLSSTVYDDLSNTLSQNMPSQLQSVRLPGNINLQQLKDELAQGTSFAEQYIQKFGSDVVHTLGKAITVLEPEENESPKGKESRKKEPRVFASRKDALMAKMRADTNTYTNDPAVDETTKVDLESFKAAFDIEKQTESIALLLDQYPDLRAMMDNLVPVHVDYTTFWQRYFYHAWRIEEDEKKRMQIAKGLQEETNEEDFKWDSDEEDNAEKVISPKDDGKKLPGESDGDYSNISDPGSTEASIVSPPLKSEVDNEEWIKTGKKDTAENEDSDSDWE